MISVSHVSATPIGMKVKATAELVHVEGRRYEFKVMAEDERGLIGEGTHSRVSVNRRNFTTKRIKNDKGFFRFERSLFDKKIYALADTFCGRRSVLGSIAKHSTRIIPAVKIMLGIM